MSQEQQQQQLQRLTDQVQMLTAELATQRLDLDVAKSALEQQTNKQTRLVLLARHLAQAFRSPRREAGGTGGFRVQGFTWGFGVVCGMLFKVGVLVHQTVWGGARPSKNFALLVGCLLRPVGQQCACAALSLALAYALLAQNACWTACSDQFGGQLGVGDACCPFLFVSGGCGQSFGRLILGSLLSEGCLLVLLLLLLLPPPWQRWCRGWPRPWHSAVVAGPCVQELRATMRAGNWEPERLQSNTS